MPALPQCLSEIHLPEKYSKTLSGETFLLANDGDDNKILLFGSRHHLQQLASSDVIFGDGTFFFAPQHFTQLYSLHGKVMGNVYPLVYSFLPDKSQETYVRVFRLLANALNENNFTIGNTTFMADFEIAARNAVEQVFPQMRIKACLFHLGQSVWRKVQSLGLSEVKILLSKFYTFDNYTRII